MSDATTSEPAVDRLGRPLNEANQVIAARIIVKADKVRGVDTPQWIRELAARKVT